MRHDVHTSTTSARGIRTALHACLITAAAMLMAATATRPAAAGTIVRFTISGVGFDVRLYDETTPSTVQNFLKYVGDGSYVGTVIHRSIPGFIWQGGGFRLEGNPAQAVPIATYPPVVNEPVWSNVRGTIAMAKVDGDPNSATSQWFFNLANNSANLDFQNGGFTVFGEVINGGMSVVDSVAGLPTGDFSGDLGPYGGNFTNTPYFVLEEGGAPNALVVQEIAVVPEPTTLALACICGILYTIRTARPWRLGFGRTDDNARAKRTKIRLLETAA